MTGKLNKKNRSNGKFATIRNLWNKWFKILQNTFISKVNLTVDEEVISFKIKCRFRQ